jgi:hypothetical protein
MTRAVLLLTAALLCVAAAPAPKTGPAKPAPRPAAQKPAVPKPAAPAKPAAPFDATSPQGLMGILDAAGAKAQTSRREDDAVFVTVASTAANFSMQFAGCDAQGRGCKAVLLDGGMDRGPATLSQINAFNQTSVMCRIYQDKTGAPHVVYSLILFRSMTRNDAATHLQAWQGCLADGRDFLKDPVGYLANAA